MLVLSFLAPALVAVVLLAASRYVGRAWSIALVPAAGAIAAYVALQTWPQLPPGDAAAWPLWTTLVAVLHAGVESRVKAVRVLTIVRAFVALIVAASTVWLVSEPLITNGRTTSLAIAWMMGAGVAIVALWMALASRADRLAGPAMPLALAGLAGGVAAVLGASGTALFAQTAGGAAIALTMAALLAARRPALRIAPALVGPTVVLLGGLLLAGAHYAQVCALSAGLLFAGALAVGLIRLPVLTTRWRAAVGLCAIVLVAATAAVGATFVGGDDGSNTDVATPEQTTDDYGYE